MSKLEKISLWIEICAVCAIVSAVLSSVVPESKLKSVYKTLSSIVMLFAFFSIVSSGRNIELNLNELHSENISEISENTDKLLAVEGERMMNRLIENRLYEGGIDALCKTEAIISDDTVKIKRIYLYGSFSEKEKETSERILKEYLKEECEVIFAKEDG